MPDGLVPVVVTSGLGVGVIAGVVSGICYVFIQGLRSTGSRRGKYGVSNRWQCCICGVHFSFLPPVAATGSASESTSANCFKCSSVCAGCDGHACTDTCGAWIRGAWLCKQCQANVHLQRKGSYQPQGWFKTILTALQPNTVTVRMSKPQGNSSSVTNLNGDNEPTRAATTPEDDKEVVRDFIERLVGAMLGADLDDTSVGRIYADAGYDAMFIRYHGDISSALSDLGSALHMSIANLPVTGQTPCTAHASLKNIIRRVLRDASNMAILKRPQNEPESTETTTNRTYEDLLATAILNKVIDNYQTDLRRSSSGSVSVSSRRSESSQRRHKRDDARWRSVSNPDADTTSISSVEEWCRSESSTGEKYVDHLSFTIQQSIEEITTSDEDHASSHYLHSHNLSRHSSRNNVTAEKEKNILREDWQDNWLFSRKGKGRGSPKPVPVPMLVPNPSTDYRALIGDRDAEDTTDLSETGSDLDENDSLQDIKSLLIDSKTVIGGKNLLGNIHSENLKKNENGEEDKDEEVKKEVIKNVEEEAAGNGDTGFEEDDDVSEAKNNILIRETTYAESDSLGSNTEKDMEYTEKYASFPRPISKNKSPVPSPRISKENEEAKVIEIISQILNNPDEDSSKSEDENEEESEEDIDIEAPMHLRGSYSEKEKEKWRNPVAIANNPYSKENLDKRLHEKSNINDNFTFGRDYYIREAKKAAGGRKKFLDEDSNTENSGHDLYEESLPVISEDEHLENHENIFKAVPVIINNDDDTPEEKENITNLESIPNSRPISLALSTDSEDVDVRRVYNIETGKIFTFKNDFTKEIIQNSKSPEGSKSIVKQYQSISSNVPDEVDSKFDENHNNQKEPIMNISHHISTLTSPEPKKESTMTKQQFLQQQISVEPDSEFEICLLNDEPKVLITPELKESSKKYLQSLVKNNNKNSEPEVVHNFTTPPVSLQEYDTVNFSETDSLLINLNNNITENINNSPTENQNIKFKEFQSCIDLRLINENTQTTNKNDLLSSISQSNGFTTSTPNLNDTYLYDSEDENKNDHKKNIISELDELITIPKPSVKDLKKLFDQEKQIKATVSRTKSHLTTKPELKAHRQIHSLTARSISKEFRKDLMKSNENNNKNNIEMNDVAEGNKEIPLEKVEDVDELKTIPPCKTKIAYFECLKNN